MDRISASNDVIRTHVVRHYRQFVAEVEPRGGVMDHLIEAGIVDIETKDRVTSPVTRQDRCRALLDQLLTSSHSQAFVVLCRALREYYPWIVDSIQQHKEQDQSAAHCSLYAVHNNAPERQTEQQLSEDKVITDQTTVGVGAKCNGEPAVKAQLAELKQQYASSQEQLLIVQQNDTDSRRKLIEMACRETEHMQKLASAEKLIGCLQRELSDAQYREKENGVKLEESLKREQVLMGKVEQAALIERLLRLEVKQAVEDERMFQQQPQQSSLKQVVLQSADEMPLITCKTESESTESLQLLQTFSGSSVAVYGLATLDFQLYIIRDRSNVIEVHNIATLQQICRLTIRHPTAPQPTRPTDMTACSATSTLYVSDYANCCIHRVDPRSGQVTATWRLDGQTWGLSVTPRATLLVCCRGNGKLCEFTSSGQLVREISLAASSVKPVHAVELHSRISTEKCQRWVVCQGGQIVDSTAELSVQQQGICIVDIDGDIIRKRDFVLAHGPQTQHMATTIDCGKLLAVDGSNYVHLLDCVKMQTTKLSVTGTAASSLLRPHRLAICQSTGRVFIGLWDGRVLVCKQIKVGDSV